LDESEWGAFPSGFFEDHTKVFISDGYTTGDSVLYLLENDRKSLLLGTPLDQRKPGQAVPLNGLGSIAFTPGGTGALLTTSLFDDHYSLGLIDFARPGEIQPVKLDGLAHTGVGELKDFSHLRGAHYALHYNINGASWLYEGIYNEEKRLMALRHVIVGDGDLAEGVLQHYHYDKISDRFVLSFSTASSPT
jgi:hypothetical protein